MRHIRDEDGILIRATLDGPGREVAPALGRTLWAVYKRRGLVRRERPTA